MISFTEYLQEEYSRALSLTAVEELEARFSSGGIPFKNLGFQYEHGDEIVQGRILMFVQLQLEAFATFLNALGYELTRAVDPTNGDEFSGWLRGEVDIYVLDNIKEHEGVQGTMFAVFGGYVDELNEE